MEIFNILTSIMLIIIALLVIVPSVKEFAEAIINKEKKKAYQFLIIMLLMTVSIILGLTNIFFVISSFI